MVSVTAVRLPDNGPPQVGITVGELDGTALVTVETSWDWGQSWNPVQGGRDQEMAGEGFVRDHFPAFNLPLLYRATTADGASALSAPIEVPSDRMWLQDPLAPRSAVALVDVFPNEPGESMLAWGSHAEAAYAQQVEETTILGARRPVLAVGQRQVASQVPLAFSHNAAREGGMLRALLMQAGQLVLRSHRHRLLDPVAYIAVTDLKESLEVPGAADAAQISEFTCTAIQGRATNVRLVVPWWTYDQVRELYAGMTYDQVRETREGATYTQWTADPQGVM